MWFPYKLDLNNSYIALKVITIDKAGALGSHPIYGLIGVSTISDADLYETEQECIDACEWMNKRKYDEKKS